MTATDNRQKTLSIIDVDAFKNTNLLSISVRKWGNSAKVRDMQALAEYLEQLKADDTNGEVKMPAVALNSTDRVKSTKKLVNSPTLKVLCDDLLAIKNWCVARSMPSYFRAGMFVVKRDQTDIMEEEISKRLAVINDRENGSLAKFIAAYPDDVETARTASVKKGGLGPLFREKDYPSVGELPELFALDWNWLGIGVAENLSAELAAKEGEKFKKRLINAAEEIENALRAEFLEMIEHAQERLTSAPGEAPKVFRETMIGNMIQFIETFNSKDVFGDERLSEIVTQARSVLLGEGGDAKVTTDKLRKFASTRAETAEQFAKIKDSLSALIEEGTTRKFDLSSD